MARPAFSAAAAAGNSPVRWRPALGAALLAALLWLALAVLLGQLHAQHSGMPAEPAATAGRLARLAQAHLWPLWLPVLVAAPAWGLLRGQWQRGLAWGLAWGLRLFGALALLWAAIGGWHYLDGQSPWAPLPGVGPPGLEAFAAAHPQLHLHTSPGSRELLLATSDKGPWMRVDGTLLPGTRASLQTCSGPPDPAQLAGLQLPPAATCQLVLALQRGGAGAPRRIYQFSLPDGTPVASVRQHHEAWAAAQQAQASVSGGPAWWLLRAERGAQHWQYELLRLRSGTALLRVDQGGQPPAW